MACEINTTRSHLTTGAAPAPLASNGKLAQLLLDSAPDAMVIIDQQGRIILVNRQTEKMFGYSRNELLDQPVEVLMPERFRKRHVEHRADFVADPHIRAMGTELDLFARYRDGSEFPVEIMLSPIRVGGQVLVSSTIRDVTERKRAEVEAQAQHVATQRMLDTRSRELQSTSEALHVAEAMATVGIVTSGILHDLNNAMMPIRIHLNALHRHESADTIRNVEGIEQAIAYIADLCKRLRPLISRAEQQDDAVTDLAEWWREVTPLLVSVLPPGVKLEPAIPDTLPPVMVGRIELTQAVFNLAHNACRALGDRESATLKIWAKPCDDGRTVCVGVTDNGPGMPSEIRERILSTTFTTGARNTGTTGTRERRQGDGQGQAQSEGTGLGLLLVKSIVSRAKGSFDIDSEPGNGTTVTLILPAKHH